jgi:phosphatidate cytidylyltransferase
MILSTLVYWRGMEFLGFFFAGFVIVITLRELFRTKVAFPIYDIATTVFGVIYVGWLLVHLELLRELPREVGVAYETGSAFLLFAFLLAWSSDTGAYFTGMAFGRHKLFPRVSPAKSVEGAVGGMLATMAAALIGRTYLVLDSAGQPLITVPQVVVFGVVVGVANQLGDLVESLLKRDAAVKDTSSMIPGHGGVLDRFDSLLFAGPVTYYFLLWVVFA